VCTAPASPWWRPRWARCSRGVEALALSLTQELTSRTAALDELGQRLVRDVRGSRLADLALNAIEIIDRNLYERSCDVRWWATDSAAVDACSDPTPKLCTHAGTRLGVILDSYTGLTRPLAWPTWTGG
jgi:hypothetical protein